MPAIRIDVVAVTSWGTWSAAGASPPASLKDGSGATFVQQGAADTTYFECRLGSIVGLRGALIWSVALVLHEGYLSGGSVRWRSAAGDEELGTDAWSPATISHDFSAHRPGGGKWRGSDLEASWVGLRTTTSGARLYEMYALVTYRWPTGAFATVVGPAAG
ncbi:MAG: hypothetical protein JW940_24760 [Polyangiaceae bacterium]|nr:hypothetical protein [Polyangiaceae bacterium]